MCELLLCALRPPPVVLSQDEALSQRRELEALFAKDTADAYRVFGTLEHFLCQPRHLRGQLQVQLGDATQVRWGIDVFLARREDTNRRSIF